MDRLYRKNELIFALIWIFIYVFSSSLAQSLSELIRIPNLLTALVHLILSAVLLFWIKKNSLTEKYGLCRPKLPPRRLLCYIPLFMMASVNLWFGADFNFPALQTVFYVVSMLCVGFLEEVIFRGLLFKAMEPDGVKSAVAISSLTFGIGHIINLFNGASSSIFATVCQIVSAMFVGFLFVTVYRKSGSLLPCIATHSILNALDAFADKTASAPTHTIIISVFLCAVSAAYSVVLIKPSAKKA